MAVIDRLVALAGGRLAARWDRFGAPGPAMVWSMHHPWLVTAVIAVVLGMVLAAAFGVPPFSPLVLVLVLVAPIAPILTAQRRIHDRWIGRRETPPGTD